MASDSVHTMPIEALRARASEVLRLIAEARVITRATFDGPGLHRLREPYAHANEAAHRVGSLLDAAQRLLPGMAPFAELVEHPPRSKPREALRHRRVTLRGGADDALSRLERASILESIAEEVGILLREIERGRASSHFPAEPPSTQDSARLPRR